MSETVQHVGTIKEIHPEIPRVVDKLKALAKDLGVELKELGDIDEDYIEIEYDYHDKYRIINNRLFDTQDAPRDDIGEDDLQEVQKIAPGIYKVALRFYNGGTCFEEMAGDVLEKADTEYDESHNMKLYYAIKFKDGTFLTRGSSIAPSLYTTVGRARGWANSNYSEVKGREYDIVPFAEVH